MKTVTELVREEENATPNIFVPVSEPKGRPRLRFRLRIESEKDVEAARRKDVPVYWLDSPTVTALGYPMSFPSMVVITESLRPVLDTSRRMLTMRSESSLLHPRFEDVALMMLSFDAMAARAIIERHKEDADAAYLARRLIEESLVESATRVRFYDSVKTLPRWGESWPKASVDRKINKNRLGVVL